jgi:SAM-dependent methyltransferase
MTLRSPLRRRPALAGERWPPAAGPASSDPAAGHGRPVRGIARSVYLLRLFRLEQTQPEVFYRGVADDAADQLASYTDLAGQTIIDVGGGAGYFTAVFRSRGAHCFLFEPDGSELAGGGEDTQPAVLADGYWLPVADRGADICFSSNVLEHVDDPAGFIDEMIRVTRPGGLIYISFTNWHSPWGGHEMSPWHLLGAGYAARRYVRRYGRAPKHEVGRNLYRIHVGQVLRMMRARGDVEVLAALPRYYPRWCAFVVRLPGIRELLTWNLLMIVRRKA